MAKADQIKKLIASYGRPDEFRAAALQIIEDEHRKGHMPLASSLKRTLDAHVRSEGAQGTGGLANVDLLTDPAVDLVDVIEPARSLADIVLSAESRASFNRLIEEQRRADELRRHRLPVRSKLLLCGPPGCGKTLSAEVIARELSLPLYIAKFDVLISSLLGQTATNLRRLFEYAVRRPSVLFLDEFDALARTRTDSGEHNELRRVVNSLLVMIDRYQGRGVLIAATNLEGALDTAVWRRFDDVVFLAAPSPEEARCLLGLTFKNFPVNFDLDSIVPKLSGLTYAEIERIALEAIKTAVLKKRKSVTETDVAAAIKAENRRQSTRRERASR
ncbi:MAG: AAA family ATPase [Rhodomicrobium sp.]